ncbi:MAG: polysaccharide biosynthesis C-terminal domain-containing protein [Clostridiales bacterium]|nr:polysaccharide biosynthesis C-terminal domain-containing protein [Clostridiales bacterium]
MNHLDNKRIRLSDNFTYGRLFRFVIPTILMMLFTSMYGVVDGLYINNYVGKEAFSAVTLITPLPLLIGAVAYMIGGGGSAVIAQALARGEKEKASQVFSFLTAVSIVGSIVLAALGDFLLEPIAKIMGADAEMLPICLKYGRILISCIPFYVLQNVFQSFLTAAEHPKIGLAINLVSAALNLILDFVFVGLFDQGVAGAAFATAVSQYFGGIVPFLYIAGSKNIDIHFVRPHFMKKVLGPVCWNGLSEFVSEIFHPLASVMYNYKLMQLVGMNGVAAYGVLMNVGFLFGAVFLGFAVGVAPIFSYQYEEQNFTGLHNTFKRSATFVVIMGFILYGIALCIEGPFAALFFGHDEELLHMTEEGFSLHSLSYMVMGLAVFTSAFFTALHNSRVSAFISFLRTLLFEVLAILILPLFFDLNGVWAASLTAEILALIVTVTLLVKKKKIYHY